MKSVLQAAQGSAVPRLPTVPFDQLPCFAIIVRVCLAYAQIGKDVEALHVFGSFRCSERCPSTDVADNEALLPLRRMIEHQF